MTATVVALPGFTRGPHHLDRLAAACAAAGVPCVRPRLAPLWLPTLYMSHRHLRRWATRLVTAINGPLVLVGHSAGASSACFLAATLVLEWPELVAGIVLVDGVDSPNHLIRESMPKLSAIPMAAVLAPPSRCNRGGGLADLLEAAQWVEVEVIADAGHGDIEGHATGIYRRVCGDESSRETADLVLTRVIHWINVFAHRDVRT